MNEDRSPARTLLTLLETMHGDEIGTTQQALALIRAAGVDADVDRTALMLNGPKMMVPVKLKTRRQMLDWSKQNGVDCILGDADDDTRYVTITSLAAALIAVVAGPDAMLGEVPNASQLRHAHAARVEHLRRIVDKETDATA